MELFGEFGEFGEFGNYLLISRMTLNLCQKWQYFKKVLARYNNP